MFPEGWGKDSTAICRKFDQLRKKFEPVFVERSKSGAPGDELSQLVDSFLADVSKAKSTKAEQKKKIKNKGKTILNAMTSLYVRGATKERHKQAHALSGGSNGAVTDPHTVGKKNVQDIDSTSIPEWVEEPGSPQLEALTAVTKEDDAAGSARSKSDVPLVAKPSMSNDAPVTAPITKDILSETKIQFYRRRKNDNRGKTSSITDAMTRQMTTTGTGCGYR